MLWDHHWSYAGIQNTASTAAALVSGRPGNHRIDSHQWGQKVRKPGQQAIGASAAATLLLLTPKNWKMFPILLMLERILMFSPLSLPAETNKEDPQNHVK